MRLITSTAIPARVLKIEATRERPAASATAGGWSERPIAWQDQRQKQLHGSKVAVAASSKLCCDRAMSRCECCSLTMGRVSQSLILARTLLANWDIGSLVDYLYHMRGSFLACAGGLPGGDPHPLAAKSVEGGEFSRRVKSRFRDGSRTSATLASSSFRCNATPLRTRKRAVTDGHDTPALRLHSCANSERYFHAAGLRGGETLAPPRATGAI
jgi:hypothetical protein